MTTNKCNEKYVMMWRSKFEKLKTAVLSIKYSFYIKRIGLFDWLTPALEHSYYHILFLTQGKER
jgi:hypothetical protein